MNARTVLPKAASGLSLSFSAFLLVLFFLPWLKVSCVSEDGSRRVEIGQATGWQVFKGDLAYDKQWQHGPVTVKEEKKSETAPRRWAILGLFLPGMAALISLLTLVGRMPPASTGKLLLLLAALGVGVTVLAIQIDYSKDGQDASGKNDALPSQEKLGKMVRTEPTPWLWTTLVMNALLGGAGGLCLMARAKPPPIV